MSILDFIHINVRSFVRRSPAIYLLSLYIRGKDIDYYVPRAEDDFFITGYPRSANTFSRFLLDEFFPELTFTTHFHSIAGLKIALRKNVTTFVILREPSEAISSYIIKRNYMAEQNPEKNLAVAVRDYVDYYAYVSQHLNRIQLLSFQTIVNRSSRFISRVENTLCTPAETIPIEKAKNRVYQKVKEDNPDSSPGYNQLPSSEKELLKQKEKKKLEKMNKFHRARELFDELSRTF